MRQFRYVYLVVMDAFYEFLADDGWAIASHIALSTLMALVGSSRVDLQACKLEYSIVSPK